MLAFWAWDLSYCSRCRFRLFMVIKGVMEQDLLTFELHCSFCRLSVMPLCMRFLTLWS